MARVLTLAILFFTTAVSAAAISPSNYPNYHSIRFVNNTSSRGNAMILPLFFKQRNSNRINEDYFTRRRLHARTIPNARMSLHDDLLLNGYYTTRLWIGTPPQQFALIVDTGSTVTYVPCSTCKQCGKHQDPRFKPESSSTYEPLKCNIDCSCDSNREQCIYERNYAEMSSSSGVLGVDIISFGNQSDLQPQRATFGCENMETGDLYSQHADGIMGLGRGDLSIVDQLVEKGVISDSFSLCYGGMDVGGGSMVLGGISSPKEMAFTHSDPVRSPYYNIELNEIHIAGKKLPLNPKVFDGKHGTVLDSGTTYAYLPQAAFEAFKAAILKETQSLKRIQGPDPNYNDICFAGAGSDPAQLSKAFPSAEMVFSNGQKLLLAPENYLFRHSKAHGAYCLGIFQNGKESTTLLGGIIVRNTLVTYDREHEKVGFWKTNCSELWERLHLSPASPPLPSDTDEVNSTTGISPNLAPTGPPQPQAPGEVKIGLIKFSMLLTINYTELKPHIAELAQFIAKDLDVKPSQVKLTNFSSWGNETLLRWAILPAHYDDYISNATAMKIVSRLSGNQLHLPDSFGSYKLSEWSVEPPPERTWWRQHYLALVIAFAVVIVIGMLASGGWFIWRRNRNLAEVPYKPVDTVVAEQELQPLQN
ncbi:aspartic proteinase nepenthesin-1-like [Salvia hispanica]|uniref:aspartic proteinase nepenthesin-1-like n=1 Tax=Salvia hispanica TaxID=49212 RepID=UPI002009D323|nr:aspartic proteinase nepenthesin-1-like [Salvia hispanica]